MEELYLCKRGGAGEDRRGDSLERREKPTRDITAAAAVFGRKLSLMEMIKRGRRWKIIGHVVTSDIRKNCMQRLCVYPLGMCTKYYDREPQWRPRSSFTVEVRRVGATYSAPSILHRPKGRVMCSF